MRNLAALLLPFLFTCKPACFETGWGYYPGMFDRYSVGEIQTTPGGVRYDDSGTAISVESLDHYTYAVEACLNRSIDRASFVVKVAADWQIGCEGSQVLPVVDYAGEGCTAKGEPPPTAACPCRYRAGIRCPNVLVVTPNLALYKDVLIRFVEGVSNPWIGKLAECAS